MTRFAFLADDFTGAIDALWQFQRFGLRTELVVDIDNLDRVSPDVDVVGVATTLRSLPVDEIEERVAPMLTALARTGAGVVQYKVCSTFDSSPEVGSIGRVIDVARRDPAFRGVVPVMPAQPELGRYTVFSHHFARFADGDVYRIDRHPIMRVHPVTPAHESDLRAEIGRQSAGPVAALHTSELSGPEMASALRTADQRREAVVVDTLSDDDASRVGTALLGLLAEASPAPALFAVGSGGLSWALARAATAATPAGISAVPPAQGAVLAVSGSRSSVTAQQIDTAAQHGWLALDLLGDESAVLPRAREAIAAGRNVVLYTSRGAGSDEPSVPDVGERLARAAASCLDLDALGRLVVMGGDTSGEVLKALGVQAIQLRAMVPPMVPLCTVTSSDPRVARLDVALKGGQLGTPEYLVALGQRS